MNQHDNDTLSSRAALTLATLGVVYGDIGTSPLYAVKEVFNPSHGIPFNNDSILGGISAIFWALVVVVTLKYVILVMRADNRGEGGIMALLALATASVRERPQWIFPLAALGICGAALFYGDAVITPAISVLSAVEGLEVATPVFKPYVLPLTIGVLIGLFAIQSHGTSAVGRLFGPVMVIWFVVLGGTGIASVAQSPAILEAVNPLHGFRFLTDHGWASFIVLGAVFLAVTGGEALYADMGHFGRREIRTAWFVLVFPALSINYFGQGALLMRNPGAVENPFYLMYPAWAIIPMVALATAATVIASQAVISGTYSITRQAIQLGFLPRANMVHTSDTEVGQIYIASANWLLLVIILAAVVGFGSSSALASAYGLAVSGTMLITTLLTFFVVRFGWHYGFTVAVAATVAFAAIDLSFVAANAVKFMEGGWFPIATGTLIFVMMMTWRRGRELLMEKLRGSGLRLEPFLQSLFLSPPVRVDGTAVFLIGEAEAVPRALMHNLLHNKVLHQRVIFLTVLVGEVPYVPDAERLALESLGNDCWRIRVRYGFKDTIDVPAALSACGKHGVRFEMMETTFFLSREKVVPTPQGRMAMWRERIFSAMSRNAGSAVDYFRIPTNRVVELGTQVEI